MKVVILYLAMLMSAFIFAGFILTSDPADAAKSCYTQITSFSTQAQTNDFLKTHTVIGVDHEWGGQFASWRSYVVHYVVCED